MPPSHFSKVKERRWGRIFTSPSSMRCLAASWPEHSDSCKRSFSITIFGPKILAQLFCE